MTRREGEGREEGREVRTCAAQYRSKNTPDRQKERMNEGKKERKKERRRDKMMKVLSMTKNKKETVTIVRKYIQIKKRDFIKALFGHTNPPFCQCVLCTDQQVRHARGSALFHITTIFGSLSLIPDSSAAALRN